MLLGCDVAFYENNPNGRINFAKMKSNGMNFVIIRAGQNIWVDSKFSVNWQDAKKAGLPRGSYWFYDSRVSPESQAKLWKDTLGSDLGELPLFADYEESYGGTYKGGENFKKFLEEVKILIPNKEIIIYSGYWYFKDNVPASLHSYFSQYKLWIANYGVSVPSIPTPFTDWEFWQFSEDGDGEKYGCNGGLDLDYYNGNLDDFMKRFDITLTEEEPEMIPEPKKTHEGVNVYEINRFGAKCIVHVIDPQKAKIFVTPRGNFGTCKTAVNKYKAQISVNGGGWPQPSIPNVIANEIWVSDGNYIVTSAKDDRGFINVSKEGNLEIRETDKNIGGLWNVWGFDRILGSDGVFNSRIKDNYTKDARTGTGITNDGKLVLLSAEGNDYYQKGLTFKEMWEVLFEFGCIAGGNNDGGSSTQCINTAISQNSLILGSDGTDANVMNHILVFATPLLEPDPISEEIPEGGNMQYKVIKSARFRSMASTTTNDTGASSVVGDVFESSVTKTDIYNSSITMVQHTNGKWLPLKIGEVIYTEEIGEVPISIPVSGVPKRVIVENEDGTKYEATNFTKI